MIRSMMAAAGLLALVTAGAVPALAQTGGVVVSPGITSEPDYYSDVVDPDRYYGPTYVDPDTGAAPFVGDDDLIDDEPGNESNCTTVDPLSSCDRSQGGDKGPSSNGGSDS